MIAVNYTTLRNNMKSCFDQVTEDQDTMIVTRKGGNVVVMSQGQYESLMETLHLVGSRANYSHLMKSIQRFRDGQTAEHALTRDES